MTRAQDLARRVNTYLSILHHLWVEQAIGVPCKFGAGPDLYDYTKKISIEVKFSKIEENKSEITWTINKEQLTYAHVCNEFYLACGIHYPMRPVHTMSRLSSTTLERNVSFREVYIVECGWVPQTVTFKLTQGKSRTKKWSSFLGYAHFIDLPLVVRSYQVKKGIIHFTEGVDEKKFCVEGKRIC